MDGQSSCGDCDGNGSIDCGDCDGDGEVSCDNMWWIWYLKALMEMKNVLIVMIGNISCDNCGW
jgi:DnaJ-class molecular chaperone